MTNGGFAAIEDHRDRDDPDSVFSFYRGVIALRHDDPMVAEGDFTMLPDQVLRNYPMQSALRLRPWLKAFRRALRR